jgi:bone morphogenetic protein receptor type-2
MIARQGCWDANNEACEVECVSTSTAYHKFCCCSGNLCNANFTVITPTEQVESVISGNQYSWQTEDSMWAMPYVWFVCSFLAMMLVILGGFLKCRRFPKSDDEQQLAPSGPGYSSNLYNVDNLKLVSMIGRGK